MHTHTKMLITQPFQEMQDNKKKSFQVCNKTTSCIIIEYYKTILEQVTEIYASP